MCQRPSQADERQCTANHLVDYDHVLSRACSAWPTGIRNRRRMRLGGAEVRVLSGSSGLCQRLCKNRTVTNRFHNFTSLVLDTGYVAPIRFPTVAFLLRDLGFL